MLLGFKTELNINNKQRTLFMKHSGVARHAWNQGLRYTRLILDVNNLAKQVGSDIHIKFPSAIDLHKWLVAEVKSVNSWYYEVSKSSPQQALRDLRLAWDRAFKKTSKPPRFKKKGQNDSFYLDGSIQCESFKIKLPKIGWVKTFERLPSGFKPKNVTISRDGNKWFVSFKQDVESVHTQKTNESVGIDFGLKVFATLSNGETAKAPVQEYKRIKAKISKLQYLNRNKERGSNRWRKAMSKIQVLHYRAKCLRQDFTHKFTTDICKRFRVICIEDLNIKGMMANHKLAGAIGLMGWHETVRQLKYKAKLYGCEIRVIGRFAPSSKTHYKCDFYNPNLLLSDRFFYCPDCDESIDRDLNASLNIERWGLAQSP